MTQTPLDGRYTPEANRIIDYLVSVPRFGKTTTDRKTLRSMLLGSDGWIMARGLIWDIRSKHVGAGIYQVWLEERT